MKKHRLLMLCIALILVVIITVTTALLLFEKQPFSFELKPPEVVHATKARKLAKRIVFGMLGPGKTANVSASEEDLNSLVSFKSVYMGIFYDFFHCSNTTVVNVYGTAEKFSVREWAPKKLVGAQGTFLR